MQSIAISMEVIPKDVWSSSDVPAIRTVFTQISQENGRLPHLWDKLVGCRVLSK